MTNYAPQSNHNGKTKQHRPKLVYSGSEGILFQGDCLMMLQQMLPDSVNLAFADPPFNLGKNYGTDSFTDRLASEQYRAWCQTWLMEMIRVLKPGGALFLYHWPKPLMELGAWLNTIPTVEFRNWVALKMKAGFPIKGRLHPAHYGMLYYVKTGAPPTFNVVRHRAPTCRHCKKELRDYGGYRKKFDKYQDESGVPWIQVSDLQRAVARAEDGATITPDQLSPELQRAAPAQASVTPAPAPSANHMAAAALPHDVSLADAVEDLERHMIATALSQHKGNVTRAARELGLTRRGLQLKLARYQIASNG